MNKKNGFTLIELLVVISIIGILAGTLFVAIKPKEQTDKAREKKALSQLSSLRTQAASVASEDPDFSFENLKNDSKANKLADEIQSNSDSWAATANLPNNKKACADSDGYIGKDKTNIEYAFGKYFCSEGEPTDNGADCSDAEDVKACCENAAENEEDCNATNGCHWETDICVYDE